MVTGFWATISAIVAVVVIIVMTAMAASVIIALFTRSIPLNFLLADPSDGEAKASMARFQLLIFTFVIGGIYLVVCLESGTLVNIPENVLLLLGVSGTTFAASKGIQAAATMNKDKQQNQQQQQPQLQNEVVQ